MFDYLIVGAGFAGSVLAERLASQANQKVLLVLSDLEGNAALAFRNLRNVLITTAAMLGTYDVLKVNCLLFDQASLQRLQELKREPLGIARWMAKQAQGGAA